MVGVPSPMKSPLRRKLVLDPPGGAMGDVQRMRPVPWPRPWAPHQGEGDPRPEIEPVLTLDTGTKEGPGQIPVGEPRRREGSPAGLPG